MNDAAKGRVFDGPSFGDYWPADDAPAPAGATRVEGRCDDCQQPYATWFADNNVWNLVMGGPDAKGDPGGMLCPRCFTVRAESVYTLPIWRLHLDRVNRVQQPASAGAAADDEAVEALDSLCLEGLIETPHGWRYRPSKARDAILASDWLREHVKQQAREREAAAWNRGWEDAGQWRTAENIASARRLPMPPVPENPYRADRGGDRG